MSTKLSTVLPLEWYFVPHLEKEGYFINSTILFFCVMIIVIFFYLIIFFLFFFQLPRLFDGCQFYFHGNVPSGPDKQQLSLLVTTAGGKVSEGNVYFNVGWGNGGVRVGTAVISLADHSCKHG
jgi:hypothetical protein